MENATPEVFLSTSPNPFKSSSTLQYRITNTSQVRFVLLDASGKQVKILAERKHEPGTYTLNWNAGQVAKGSYYVSAIINGEVKQSISVIKQ